MKAKKLRRDDVFSYQGERYYAITDAHLDGSLMAQKIDSPGKELLTGKEEVELSRKGRLNNREHSQAQFQ